MKAERSKFQSFQFCANGSNSWRKLIGWSWSWLVVCLKTSLEVARARVKEWTAHSGSERQVSPLEHFQKLHDLHKKWLMTPYPNVPARVLVLDADQDIGFFTQLTKSIPKEVLIISADPKICKDIRSEIELLDWKILRPQKLQRVEFGRAIFREI